MLQSFLPASKESPIPSNIIPISPSVKITRKKGEGDDFKLGKDDSSYDEFMGSSRATFKRGFRNERQRNIIRFKL